jgi:hypothetical protein
MPPAKKKTEKPKTTNLSGSPTPKPKATSLSGGVVADFSHLLQPGDKVSLNCRVQSRYYAPGIALNREEPYGSVPQSASAADVERYNKSLQMKILLKGHVKTIDSGAPEVLDFYIEKLDRCKSHIDLRDPVIGLTKTDTMISGWRPIDILIKMHERERDNMARQQVLQYLEQAKRASGSCGTISEDFNEEKHAKAETVFRPNYNR